jgi:hypothetical protein
LYAKRAICITDAPATIWKRELLILVELLNIWTDLERRFLEFSFGMLMKSGLTVKHFLSRAFAWIPNQ